jgi:class 3 adenylate cyclase
VAGEITGGDRLELIEVVLATPTRRVSKAFDRELRQVVSVTAEHLPHRDRDGLVGDLRPFLELPRHTSIAPLLDAYVDGDHVVMVSPWVEGVDLLALLQASGTPGLPVTAVLGWLDQIGDAVRHLNRHGVVHGDLRPANLVLGSEQRISVIGLGTGLLLDPPAVGDPRIDVRGVAATAAALLTGSSPSVGAITGTAQVSGAALGRALLPALDDRSSADVTIDTLLRGLRQELNAALPTGVVTFLLTDIVGSTRQWEADERSMSERLARHDLLMAEAVEAAGGRLLKARGEGDATFSVFTKASAGVQAAVDAHARLRQQTGLMVRMAVHTGEAELREADYYGRTVNRAARLRSVAPDGGILVSSATADLVVDALPPGCSLVDRGAMALKDLDRAEHVFQVVGEGLAPTPLDLPAAPAAPVSRPASVPPTHPPQTAPDGSGAAAPPARRRPRPALLAAAAAAIVAAVAVAAIAVAGGGGGGDGDQVAGATSTTEQRSSTTVDTSPAVSELLLTAADLPAEITTITPLPLDTEDEPCGQQSVDLRIPPTGRAAFSAGDAEGEITITEVVRQFTDPSTARRAHGLILDSFGCDTIRIENSSGQAVEGSVAPASDLAVPGAASASYTTLDFGAFAVGLSMAQVDRYQVVVQYGSFDLRGPALEQQVRSLLELAVQRLSAAAA